jgi:hypothetical protein
MDSFRIASVEVLLESILVGYAMQGLGEDVAPQFPHPSVLGDESHMKLLCICCVRVDLFPL